MTEQPPEQPEPPNDGRDHATPEQRLARAHLANDLANALITLRDNLPAAAKNLEDTINDTAEGGYLDPVENVRMLANVCLNLTSRISHYAQDLDYRADDVTYFTNKHARIVLIQQTNPVMRSINRHHDNA